MNEHQVYFTAFLFINIKFPIGFIFVTTSIENYWTILTQNIFSIYTPHKQKIPLNFSAIDLWIMYKKHYMLLNFSIYLFIFSKMKVKKAGFFFKCPNY